jgi:uncharacterized membrane protein
MVGLARTRFYSLGIALNKLVNQSNPTLFIGLFVIGVSNFLLSPLPIGPGLDPSWIIGTEKSVEYQRAFGTEFVWTYGPFSPGTLGGNVEGTNLVHLFSVVIFASIFTISTYPLVRNRNWSLLLGPFLLAVVPDHNAKLMFLCTLPFFTALTLRKFDAKRLFLVSIPLISIFPLIKGNLLPVWLTVLFAGTYLFLGRPIRGLVYSLSLTVSGLLIYWIIAHQNPVNILAFFRGQLELALGFSDAMSSVASLITPATYVSAIVISMALLLTLFDEDRARKLLIICVLGALSFIAFKQAFVRADGHQIFALWEGLFIVATIIGLVRTFGKRTRGLQFVTAISMGLLLTIPASVYDVDFSWFVTNPVSKPLNAPALMTKRLGNFKSFNANPEPDLRAQQAKFCSGASDIYPWEQHYVVGNPAWNPRPVFQSYSAYTDYLAKLNSNFLENTKPGTRIIVDVQNIDSRLPLQEEDDLIPNLGKGFKYLGQSSIGLCFERNSEDFVRHEQIPLSNNGEMGEWETLDQAATILSVRTRKTPLGVAAGALWRSDQLYLDLRGSTGKIVSYRVLQRTLDRGLYFRVIDRDSLLAEMAGKRSTNNDPVSFRIREYGLSLQSYEKNIQYGTN